ncbi:N-acetylmuramoyl-L-alanine amidase [Paenibacillus septentrionalis]|uniref:N-acetylmuramoyl-L-alanine amidase n=1 Tax=Paenibacillus septentrionalis TaxID=429342 RepID=A0ABW1V789_9BACL
MKIKHKIFVYPGHGGKDPGATFETYKEADIVLEISFLRHFLEKFNHSVLLSRVDNNYIELKSRSQKSNALTFAYFTFQLIKLTIKAKGASLLTNGFVRLN